MTEAGKLLLRSAEM